MQNQYSINQTNNTIPDGCIVMPQMLPIKEVVKITSLSRPCIYDMMDEFSERYDPTFPRQVKISHKRVAWVASEVAEWINNKIDSRSA